VSSWNNAGCEGGLLHSLTSRVSKKTFSFNLFTHSSVRGLILQKTDMLSNIRDVLILWDDDDTEVLCVVLKIGLNREVRSIGRGIHTVREAFLVEDRVDRNLNKVVEFEAAVNPGVFIKHIRGKHLGSKRNLVRHVNAARRDHLKRVDRDKAVDTVVVRADVVVA